MAVRLGFELEADRRSAAQAASVADIVQCGLFDRKALSSKGFTGHDKASICK